uniref:Uncharacterized protein n=1 Tax=Moniliophthora roreri TaxID=221103 RepID=A0A0W0F162_MONRR
MLTTKQQAALGNFQEKAKTLKRAIGLSALNGRLVEWDPQSQQVVLWIPSVNLVLSDFEPFWYSSHRPGVTINNKVSLVPAGSLKEFCEQHNILLPHCAHGLPSKAQYISPDNSQHGIAGKVPLMCNAETTLTVPFCSTLFIYSFFASTYSHANAPVALYEPQQDDRQCYITIMTTGVQTPT